MDAFLKIRSLRMLVLLSALALVLLPLGWFGMFWQPLGALIDTLFPTDLTHALGHTTLFAILGAALLLAIPPLRRRPWLYLALILLAGIGQEAFQALYKGRVLLFDDTRDIITDLLGGLLTLMFMQRVWRRAGEESGARSPVAR